MSRGYPSCVRTLDRRSRHYSLLPQFIHCSPLLLREAGESSAHGGSHLPLSRSESSYCSSSSIHIEDTSRSRGVISQESPEPGYIVLPSLCLCLTRFRHHQNPFPRVFPSL